MQNKTGKQSMMVYVMVMIAAFSIALLANVNTQLFEESIEKSDSFSNSKDATLEMALDPPSDANLGGENGGDEAQTEFNPIDYSPAPLIGPLGIAEAGLDQIVNEGAVVQFDGSGSYDPLGTIDGYYWDLDTDVDSDSDGNKTNDIDATGPTPIHIYGDDGIYNVSLRVTSIRQSGGTVKVDQDVVLIIDSSGSMLWNDPDDIRIDAAKHYVYMLTPDDNVAVVDFDDQTTLLQGLTMDYYAAMLALDLIDSSGGTTLSPALDESITELEVKGNIAHVWAIILLTDAESLKQWDITECYAQTNRAVNDNIVIYTIGLNIDTPQEKQLLEDIANLTGGKYYSPPNASHLFEIYENISEEVENTTSGMVNDTDTLQVIVENVDPAVGSFSASGGDEGAVITYTSTATDPGSDDLRFTWNWGDGTPDTINTYYNDGVAQEPIYDKGINKIKSPGGTFPFSATDTVDHIYGDDGVYSITLTVEDDDGGINIKIANITVYNVAPTIGSVSTADGNEGALITYSSTATDSGSDDLTFTWNWGDGTSDTINIYYNDGVGPDPDPSPLGTYPFSATDVVDHTYGDNGVYTITLTVEDDDGGKTANTTTVAINNVAPTIDSIDTPPGDEGALITFSSTATDPGSDDLTFTWNWGDGSLDTITVYYNDGLGPEPIYDPVTNEIKSPWGNYPFSVSDAVGHTYGDNGVYTITLTVEDDDGGKTVNTTSINITNIAPTIDTVLAPPGEEGAVIEFSSTATDPGSDDLTFTWNWGDGTSDTVSIYYNNGVGPDPFPSPWGTYPFSVTDTIKHTYGDNGVYTITITVEDDDNGVTVKTTTVTISNVAPSIDTFDAQYGDEGAILTYSSTATDPGSDDLTFTWNWGDGTSDTITIYYNDGIGPEPVYDPVTNEIKSPWGTFPFSGTDTVQHTYGDNGIYTITLTVEDDDGEMATKTQDVEIFNVAPTIDIFLVPESGDEGALITYSSTATDPGSDDLTFTWNWGDGTSDTITVYYNDGVAPEPDYDPSTNEIKSPWGTFPFSATNTVQHTYGDNGNYTITLTVEDDDGGVITKTEMVEIFNVAPTIDIFLVPESGDEGALISFNATASDPGSDDLIFTWNWGDGTSDSVAIYYNDGIGPDPFPSPWGTFPFSATDMMDHIYGDNWVYSITLTIEDDDGGLTVGTRNVTIQNVAPTVNIVGSLKMFEGSPVDLTAVSTDPGSDDLKFTWEFELGPTIEHMFYNDGIDPDPLPSPLGIYPFTITDTSGYLYGDNGYYEIKLTVEDDDGGSTTYTNFIDVQNVAPRVEVEAYALVNFTLRIAGEKWHDVRLYIYEDDVEVGFVGVVRYPGSPDDQSVTISNVKCHVTAAINATVYYTPDDDPINGQRNGANPCWIKIGFEDDSYEILKHTFNVRHPETWEWNIGMNHYFVGHKITFKAKATDPGSDDLTCIWNWGDGSPTVSNSYYNNGVTPEPIYDPITNHIKSPGGIYPCTETDMKEHTYTRSGNYIATLTVTDDDGGIIVYSLNINLS